MQTIQTTPSVNRFLVDQDEDGDSVGSVPITAPFRIGRREGFDLCLPSLNVSGLHAEILDEDGELWIYDLNSTNGTYLNDEKIDVKAKLEDNDLIVFGNRKFRVILNNADAFGGRNSLATVPNAVPASVNETPKQKFQRLLDSGAVPFFQPIYNISSDSRILIGYEVLGRSRIFGLNTPEQMFAAALPLDMESELSSVLRQRGIEAAEDNVAEDLTLFVNTHPAELKYSVLGKSLHELRKAYPKRLIILELSESHFTDTNKFSEIRGTLRNLDIGLALHDFSAGRIHLANLNEIAPDVVKFDCALLQGINKASLKHQRLIRAMVKMVKELGITPMAEYIESSDEHQSLVQLGFEYAQGFHYGQPIDITDRSITDQQNHQTDTSKNQWRSSVSAEVDSKDSNLRPVDLLKNLAKSDNASQTEQGTSITTDESESRSPEKNYRDPNNYRDPHWLMQQPENYYTIQLMMSHLKSEAEGFLAKQNLAGEYSMYHKQGKNNAWFVVLHGLFENRAKANPHAESFKKLGISPLIRRISAVQSEIRKTRKEEASDSLI